MSEKFFVKLININSGKYISILKKDYNEGIRSWREPSVAKSIPDCDNYISIKKLIKEYRAPKKALMLENSNKDKQIEHLTNLVIELKSKVQMHEKGFNI